MPGAALAEVDLSTLLLLDSGQTNLSTTYSSFNRRTGEMSYRFSLTNSSASSLSGPVYLEIDSLTSTDVSVNNADDTTNAGMPIFIFSHSDLASGQTVTRNIVFLNPSRVRFNFNHTVYATLPVQDTVPPQVSIASPSDGQILDSTSVVVSGTATDDGQLNSVTVNGVAAAITGDSYTATIALSEGGNTITVTATDAAGNTASASIAVTVALPDVTPPSINIAAPVDGTVVTEPQIVVSGNAADDILLAGVTVNGVSATIIGDAYTATITLSGGDNVVTATATDSSGNTASAAINVTLLIPDTTPPVVSISSPVDGSTVSDANQTVTGRVSDNVAVQGVSVNGVAAVVSGATFSANLVLSEGANVLTATATDTSSNSASATVNVTLGTMPGDMQGPTLSILRPLADGLVITQQPIIELSYSDPSGVDASSISLTANGSPVTASCNFSDSGGICTPTSSLPEGDVTLVVSISDTLGNATSQQVQFTVDSQVVEIAIDSPLDGLITKDASIQVSGTTGTGVASVSVNGVDATLGGGGFTVTVPLREGKNMLVALATKTSGRTGTDSVDVTHDIVAPIVQIDSPRDGFVSVDDVIAVTGKVNDIVSGATNARVFVNGIEATVGDGTFMVIDMPLVRGSNTIEAVATDAVGNEGRHSISVTFQPVVGVRLSVLSGNGQNALVNSELSDPIVVQVNDNLGNPVAGRVVTFKVTRNNGVMSTTTAGDGERMLQIPTNGSGQAQVFFNLGDTSGEGNNRINVTALGVTGEVEFCATALAEPADKILMVEGDNQRGVVGHPLATPPF